MIREYIVPLSEDEAFYGFKDVAAPLIRCKDCKNKDECQWYYFSGREDGFCAWAERKEQ